jgi:hypothetical protein
MTRDNLANRTQNSRTIWRQTNSAPHHNGKGLLGLFQGQMVLGNGETGVCAGVEAIDMTDESEPFAGSLMVLLADGSVSNQTFEGMLNFRDGDSIVGGKGTWETVNGTGRFANFQCNGSFNWKADGDDYHAEYTVG